MGSQQCLRAPHSTHIHRDVLGSPGWLLRARCALQVEIVRSGHKDLDAGLTVAGFYW